MPYITKETKVRRTWRERLLSLPWRPWVSTNTIRTSEFVPDSIQRWERERIVKMLSDRAQPLPSRTIRGTTPGRSFTSAPATPAPAVESTGPSMLDFMVMDSLMHSDSSSARSEPETMVSGRGGDFGGGGATSSWSDSAPSTSCDTSSSSDYSSSSSYDSGSCSSDSGSSSSSD